MTQSSSSSDDAFKDSLNFVKKLWGSMGVPGMGASGTSTMPGMAMPTTSLEELDKRIQELKSVETWLNMNVGMLHSTIQALEIQRATIANLQSFGATMSGISAENMGATNAAAPDMSADFTPLINQSTVWWNAVQEQFKQALGTALAANVEAAKAAKEKAPTKKRASTRTTKNTKTGAKNARTVRSEK